jgi:hypothetical protein
MHDICSRGSTEPRDDRRALQLGNAVSFNRCHISEDVTFSVSSLALLLSGGPLHESDSFFALSFPSLLSSAAILYSLRFLAVPELSSQLCSYPCKRLGVAYSSFIIY